MNETTDHSAAVALAEYAALRDEIVSIRSVQKNVLSIALAAYAAGFSAYAGSDNPAANELLWVLPPIGFALCAFQMSESVQMTRASHHIDKVVWPALDAGRASRWEARPADDTRKKVGLVARAVTTDGLLPTMLIIGSVVAIKVGEPTGGVACLAWAAVALTGVAPGLAALTIIWIRKTDPGQG